MVTIQIIQDTRVQKKDKTFRIKLRVTFQRKRRYYPLPQSLTIDDWEKVQSPKSRGEHKELRLYFNKVEQRANEVLKTIEIFTFQEFERKFNGSKSEEVNVFSHFDAYIKELREEERINTAVCYECTKNSLLKFLKKNRKSSLTFIDVSVEFLKKYEKWMLDNGNSTTTISIYIRSLRTMINLGIDKGLLERQYYPFGKRKYVIPSAKNIKKALTLEEIKRIVEYTPKSERQHWAKDFWILSYLCNGINIKDLALLKFENLQENQISFYRAKTKNAYRANPKLITIALLPQANTIIERLSSKSKAPNNYIFDIINDTDDGNTQRRNIQQTTKLINKYMKQIGEALEIDKPLTTYAARHSFATVLKRSGASIEFISESLGHKNVQTTENYLDSFELETKLEMQKSLLNF